MSNAITLQDVELILKRIVEKLREYTTELYIYGSVKNGCMVKGESDLDLLIIPMRRLSYKKLWQILDNEITELLKLGLAPYFIIFKKGMNHLLKSVKENGRRLI